MKRCTWVDVNKPDYVEYHDREWGVPVRDDARMFEFLVLETQQAGLSWYTVLQKRENYRKAFAAFDMHKIARFGDAKIEKLMTNPGLIRNRAKLKATVANARAALEVCEEFESLCDYFWGFVGDKPRNNRFRRMEDCPTTSEVSDMLSKDMKRRGFKFVGSTTIYAHMQATGMVNDHLLGCYRRREIIGAG
ncbi:MAG: DNA-3-methyladenine glycosylase I [Pseudomonadota bacterium]